MNESSIVIELRTESSVLLNVAANSKCLSNWPVYDCYTSAHHLVHIGSQGDI